MAEVAVTAYRLAAVCDAGEFGGAERALELLIGGLPAGVAVAVVGSSAPVVARLVAARPGSTGQVVASALRERRAALRRAAPDVVHLNLPALTSCRPSVAAALSLRLPAVLVDHLPAPGLRRRGRLLQLAVTTACAARVSVGEQSSRDVERYAGLRRHSVLTVHNGVDPLPGVAPRAPVAGRLRVATLCRLVPDKGVDVLLRALALVPQAEAEIAGTGPVGTELRALAAELGLVGRVRFRGWADPADVLRDADAVVLPSRREGLPLTLLEAMHAGFPAVATRVGSVAEAVEDGVTGRLVAPDSPAELARALVELAGAPERRAQWGAAGRERARQRFTTAAMAAGYDRVYRSAMRGRR
jgi:glycosyltransferase involved in cell wall biosynthesis